MNFVQAMIVPTMVSLGVGTLLVAQNLSLMDVTYAAPADAPATAEQAASGSAGKKAPSKAANGAKSGEKTDAAGASPAPVNSLLNSPEFGGKGPDGTVIRALTESELTIKAVENSGREDPFMALVPPDSSAIFPPPLPSLGPILPPVPTPVPQSIITNPAPTLAPPVINKPPRPIVPVATRTQAPLALIPKVTPTARPTTAPFAGEKAPPPQEPQWLIRGVISTGLERICLLEGHDEQVHARVGDKLSDGSEIEAISNRGVTFIRGGMRFVKVIGGQN